MLYLSELPLVYVWGAIPLTTSMELEKTNLIQGYGGSTKPQFYENDEEYITYCIPEQVKTIDDYRDMRRRYG